MRTLVVAILSCFLLVGASQARTVSIPAKNPALVVTLPSKWKTDEIDYGWSAMSAGEDVFISIEYARGKSIDDMMQQNDDWMKQNEIKPVKPTKDEGLLNGIKVTHYGFDTTDRVGRTILDFYIMPAGRDVALLTIWGSVAERERHAADLNAFIASIKPVK